MSLGAAGAELPGDGAGVAGAFVAGNETLVETLIQNARTYIYTTATPPLLAHARAMIEGGSHA